MEWLETSNRRGKRCYVERAEGPSPSDGPSTPGRGQGQAATPSKRSRKDTSVPTGSYEQDVADSVGPTSLKMPRKAKVGPFTDSTH
jgi:hypothetical protein